MKPDNPKSPTKNRQILIGIGLVILVLIAGLLLYRSQHKPKNNQPPTQKSTVTPEAGSKQTEDELRNYKQEVTIKITANGPLPQTLNIPNNTRIIFYDQDSVPHTIAITPGTTIPNKFYNNRAINPNNGYPYVINQTGTFHYYDVGKPILNGTIIVK